MEHFFYMEFVPLTGTPKCTHFCFADPSYFPFLSHFDMRMMNNKLKKGSLNSMPGQTNHIPDWRYWAQESAKTNPGYAGKCFKLLGLRVRSRTRFSRKTSSRSVRRQHTMIARWTTTSRNHSVSQGNPSCDSRNTAPIYDALQIQNFLYDIVHTHSWPIYLADIYSWQLELADQLQKSSSSIKAIMPTIYIFVRSTLWAKRFPLPFGHDMKKLALNANAWRSHAFAFKATRFPATK